MLQYNYDERHYISAGIPSYYTLFVYTSGFDYTPSHIPQVTQDSGDTTITILVILLLTQTAP